MIAIFLLLFAWAPLSQASTQALVSDESLHASITLQNNVPGVRVESGEDASIVSELDENGRRVLLFQGNADAADGEGAMILLSDVGDAGATSFSLSMSIKLNELKLATLVRHTSDIEEIGTMLYLLDSGYVGFRLADRDGGGTLRSSRRISPDDGWVDISVKWDGRIEAGQNALLNVGGTIDRGRFDVKSVPSVEGDLSLGGLQRSRDGNRPGGQYFAGAIREFSFATLKEGALAAELRSRSDFINVSPIFSSGMIMQRDAQVPVWGWAEPGTQVTVEIAGQTHPAIADDRGRWEVKLDPVPAGEPRELIVRSGVMLTFSDVLFGEVWLCSGQSNMEWTMRNTDEYDEELEAVRTQTLPIRQFKFDRILRAHPDRNGASAAGWVQLNATELSHFTAVGYHFARSLHDELDVPIGLINSTWGGSQIAPWIPMSALESDERLEGYAEWIRGAHENNRLGKKIAVAETKEWLARAELVANQGGIAPTPPRWPSHPIHENRQTPTGMYNAMVAPVAGYGLRGFLWYQGESNRQDRGFYEVLMQSLIAGWRDAWGDDDLAFYFVQLAPFRYGDNPDSLPHVQDAQRRVAMTIPNTAMAVISDQGDLDDIHPRRKREVGRRLANFALKQQYGIEGRPFNGPMPIEASVDGDAVRIRFESPGGLSTRDGNAPGHFELVDVDGTSHSADATIDGMDIVLSLGESISDPIAIRFAWSDTAIPNLISENGLPTSPFVIPIERGQSD